MKQQSVGESLTILVLFLLWSRAHLEDFWLAIVPCAWVIDAIVLPRSPFSPEPYRPHANCGVLTSVAIAALSGGRLGAIAGLQTAAALAAVAAQFFGSADRFSTMAVAATYGAAFVVARFTTPPGRALEVAASLAAGATTLCVLPRLLPRSFSLGEVMLAAQAVAVIATKLIDTTAPATETAEIVVVLTALFAGMVLLSVAMTWTLSLPILQGGSRRTIAFYGQLAAVAAGLAYPWVAWRLQREPVRWLWDVIVARPVRPLVLLYWALCLLVFLAWHLRGLRDEPRLPPITVVRKAYHGLAVVMFIPAIVVEPMFTALSYGIALGLLLFFELMRHYCVPPWGVVLRSFMGYYVDVQDAGVAILTHTYLLLGCALPLWLEGADDLPKEPSAAAWRLLTRCSGVLILGVGDAMASVVGTKRGRRRWPGTRKTIEGTAAGVVSTVVVGVAAVYLARASGYDVAVTADVVGRFCVAALAAAMFEAMTTQIDNVVLPLYFYAALGAVEP